jgi:hypothetical protein
MNGTLMKAGARIVSGSAASAPRWSSANDASAGPRSAERAGLKAAVPVITEGWTFAIRNGPLAGRSIKCRTFQTSAINGNASEFTLFPNLHA